MGSGGVNRGKLVVSNGGVNRGGVNRVVASRVFGKDVGDNPGHGMDHVPQLSSPKRLDRLALLSDHNLLPSLARPHAYCQLSLIADERFLPAIECGTETVGTAHRKAHRPRQGEAVQNDSGKKDLIVRREPSRDA